MKISSQIETISPKTATSLLQSWNGNRNVSKVLLDRYTKDMAANQFESLNGETLKVSESGKLVDGQHRLMALVAANATLKFLVVRGVAEESFVTIDSGKSRSVADVVGIAGFVNTHTAVAAARIMIQFQELGLMSRDPRLKPSKTEIIRFIEINNETIQASIHLVERAKARTFIGMSIPVAIHALATMAGLGAKADRFMTELGSGIFDVEDVTRHPVYLLRQRLIAMATQRVKPQPVILCGFVIKAWNAFAQNRKVGVLKFIAGEEFPVMCLGKKNGA
jgi:hypothetical protein